MLRPKKTATPPPVGRRSPFQVQRDWMRLTQYFGFLPDFFFIIAPHPRKIS